ncbi:sigma-70 family RNA polymerase sigma factor [Ktedonosporobacter rubrisoli]|uniref:Sigma-70 family RNA polymerase sigma factor n=1 Tax=Ktedonosporobacter rubrisoli TaxID=2509675 RepID=A0A4P6JLQ6_KTERU|nr:sigma-70 family RNA polymerase sigma factor [Ktedonosporobacter rubrisoli]QBD76013.1 sigma-70 family RNA polymerase sigma factor [Ktedonosporobacter rubrisoli]
MDKTLTDSELVRAAQAGHVPSLGLLLERHRAAMRAVALSLLGFGPEAEDAVQDATLLALQRLGEVRDPHAVGAWLRAIVRNVCRMRLRAQRAAPIADQSFLPQLPVDPPSPEEVLERHALRDWVWHALQELSEPLQLVVLLRYFSSITSYEQIAALCGVPIGTVRSRLNQARRKLGERLLATATSMHDDVAVLTARRWREVRELFAAAEQGDVRSVLSEFWSANLALLGPKGQPWRGTETLAQVIERDLAAGVRQQPVEILASQRLTIIEAKLLSPPWDPKHCPPGVVWVLMLKKQRVERGRLFHLQPPAADPA